MKITNDSFKIYSASCKLHKHSTKCGTYWTGVVSTPIGYVEVYAQDGRDAFTTLRFIRRSVIYSRSIPGLFTERGIAVVAHRYAKEILNNAGHLGL